MTRSLSVHALITTLLAVTTIFFSVRAEVALNLGLAEPYAILAGSTVTSTGTVGTVVNGNIGIFPGTAITGFPPAVLNGVVDSANGASGGAQGALTTAYDVLSAKAATAILSNQDMGGMTLLPGVYKFASTATLNGALTLNANGDASAKWTFQVAESLLIAEGSSVSFKNSVGNPDYVYWQVGTTATLAKGVPMIGNILALASIVVNDGATVRGRCLARNAEVTLDRSVITKPSVVSFRVKQKLSGSSLEQYNEDPTLSSATIKTAISMSMIGVAPANIENLQVSSGENSRSLASASVKSLNLKYEVVVSSTMTAEDLKALLKAAIADGSFDIFLRNAAINNGATNLQSASGYDIVTEPISRSDSSGSDQSTLLSVGAIVGVAIGSFVCLALLAVVMFYFCVYNTREPPAQTYKSTIQEV